MRYFVAYTWFGHTVYKTIRSLRYKVIACFDDGATADAVCRDLNRHAE